MGCLGRKAVQKLIFKRRNYGTLRVPEFYCICKTTMYKCWDYKRASKLAEGEKVEKNYKLSIYLRREDIAPDFHLHLIQGRGTSMKLIFRKKNENKRPRRDPEKTTDRNWLEKCNILIFLPCAWTSWPIWPRLTSWYFCPVRGHRDQFGHGTARARDAPRGAPVAGAGWGGVYLCGCPRRGDTCYGCLWRTFTEDCALAPAI